MIPPQKRSGTSTAKCHSAIPTMHQMRTLMAVSLGVPRRSLHRVAAASMGGSACMPVAPPLPPQPGGDAAATGVTRAPVARHRSTMRSGQALTALLIRALPAPLHHNAIAEDRHLIEMESAAVAQRRDVH